MGVFFAVVLFPLMHGNVIPVIVTSPEYIRDDIRMRA